MLARIIPVVLLGAFVSEGARGQKVDEYQVKAAFLYNFAKFVEWPAQSFKTAADPISICVFGSNPFGSALDEATAGKTVDGRRFVVHEVSEPASACNCHIVFVGASERKRFQAILGKLRSPGVLTVGDTEGFAAQGGVINFRLEGGKVRFEVNVEAAAQVHLRLSSKLLALAEIVKDGGQK